MLKARTRISMIGFMAILVSPIALAQVTTEYPGTFCVAQGSAQSVFYGANGDARNLEATTTGFVCPAIQQGGDVVDLSFVNVLDNHATDDVSCSINVRAVGSLNGVVGPAAVSAGTGVQTLFFDAMPAFANGVKFMRCRVPARQEEGTSRILNYRVTEQ